MVKQNGVTDLVAFNVIWGLARSICVSHMAIYCCRHFNNVGSICLLALCTVFSFTLKSVPIHVNEGFNKGIQNHQLQLLFRVWLHSLH